MALHKNLVELVQSKVSALRNAEEKRNTAFLKLEDCEREKVKLLARIKELDEKLRRKTREVYPQLKSDTASKRRRADQFQREVDENMALHKNLVELVQSKVSALRNAEEKRNTAFLKLEDCEREKVKLLARIKELDEKLRRKTREVEQEGAQKTCFCNETCVRKWKREKMLLLTRRRRTMA
ncbi:hypothetical protein DEO72_LG3g1021 [Vigna unguiculata]|uniref:Uncharacterized protein n=1 Tax=Vigna unguiculata TaxID=3917 RepID=A0A4D6LD98_VIGUN|nr:hypothetical protein DEO72_LG3g1021 [Vigna unguiculata]